jgi:cell division protein ZapA (FtsZ GTPase activity inhibitor)
MRYVICLIAIVIMIELINLIEEIKDIKDDSGGEDDDQVYQRNIKEGQKHERIKK